MNVKAAASNEKTPGAPGGPRALGRGGVPPPDGGLEKRVAFLEVQFATVLPTLATKKDLADVRMEMAGMHAELHAEIAVVHTEIAGLRGELHTEIAQLRDEVHTGIAQLRDEVRTEIAQLRDEVHVAIGGLRTEVLDELHHMRVEFLREIGKVRADFEKFSLDIMKWMVATVISLFIGFAGVFYAMSNILRPAPAPLAVPAPSAAAVAPSLGPPSVRR